MFNSTQYAGQTVTFDVDGTLYSVNVATNGTHSKGQLQLTGQAAGSHTIQLVNPAGCFDPVVVTCGVSGGAGSGWDSFDRMWLSSELGGKATPSTNNLLSNYPNPFNPTTVISYATARDAHVRVRVYNMIGEVVATLVDEHLAAGSYTVAFNASSLPSGVYIYELNVEGSAPLRKKALFLK